MLDTMSLRMKLLLLSALAMMALITAVITGILGIRSGVQGIDEIGRHRLPSVIALQVIKEAQVALKSSTYETGLWENDYDAREQFEGIAKDKKQLWVRIDQAWKAHAAIPRSPEETALWNRFVKEWDAWKKIDLQLIDLINQLAANQEEARQQALYQDYFMLGGQQRQSYQAAEKLLNEVVDLNARKVEEETRRAEKSTRLAQNIMLAVGVSAIIATSLLAFLVTLSIMKQMGGDPGTAVRITRSIADGDLDVEVPIQPGDDSSLLAAMKTMREQLTMVVSDIRTLVNQAARGDFSGRIDVAGKQGFGREISEDLNTLVRTTDEGLRDITRVSQALSAGDLSHTIEGNYRGQFGQTTGAINSTVRALREVVEDVRRLVDAAANGDFSQSIDTGARQGYAKTLAELLNNLNTTANGALTDISRVAHLLARGDLAHPIETSYPGLFGQTAQDINTTITSLHDLVEQIKQASTTINLAATEISAGNADLSRRTEEEANSLQVTAQRMEKLNGTVKQNVEHARQANEHAQRSAEIAERGGQRVRSVVQTMSAIQDSSRKMADIVGVIDGIAFQTNILALNAAVEAARAGEQGRGFAVVATEVRALSQRSATAAREIKSLIDDTLSKVADGGQLVAEAGTTMNEVVESFRQVVSLVTEIAGASREQSGSIELVTKAIESMDEVTQRNASLVEEAAAAAESLQDQASHLVDTVGRFKGAETDVQELRRGPPLRLGKRIALLSSPSPLDD